LGEVPLAGGMPNEDMFHLDDEDVGEGGGEGGGEEEGEHAMCTGRVLPRQPLLAMPSFYATEEYEVERSHRCADAMRRGTSLDGSRRGGWRQGGWEDGEGGRGRRSEEGGGGWGEKGPAVKTALGLARSEVREEAGGEGGVEGGGWGGGGGGRLEGVDGWVGV
jgi:hypothetical protein